MALSETVQDIISGYEYEVRAVRFLWMNKGTNFKLKGNITLKQFWELFGKTCEMLGNPVYVHTYYGYVWEKDGSFVTFKSIEESYNCEVTNFYIFHKLPRGKKLTYRDYTQTVESVKRIFAQHGLTCADSFHYSDETFGFLTESDKAWCLLTIKRSSLFFAYSEKEQPENGMTQIVPRYTRTKKMRFDDLSVIEREVENCFIAE